MEFILEIIALLSGLALLVFSSDHFVIGASKLAHLLKVPSLVIGVVIIGFGTSAPELLVSFLAGMKQSGALGVGNAFGSNIFNISICLGLVFLFYPVFFSSQLIMSEIPLCLILSMGLYFFIGDFILDVKEAYFLIGILLLIMSIQVGIPLYRLYLSRKTRQNNLAYNLKNTHLPINDPLEKQIDTYLLEHEKEMELSRDHQFPFYLHFIPIRHPLALSILQTILGFIILLVSSQILLWGAIKIATRLNISEVIIGLTIVATGTSLPELASALSAAKKKEYSLVMGNILGSFIFNTLGVLGVSAFFHPISLPRSVIERDWMLQNVSIVIIFLFAIWELWKNKNTQNNQLFENFKDNPSSNLRRNLDLKHFVQYGWRGLLLFFIYAYLCVSILDVKNKIF